MHFISYSCYSDSMSRKNLPFRIYVVICCLVAVALTTMNIVKGVNGELMNKPTSDFLFLPIFICKLLGPGLSLLFSLYLFLAHKDKAIRFWSSFICLFMLICLIADLLNGLGYPNALFICFAVAYTLVAIFRKPRWVEVAVRAPLLIAAILFAVLIGDRLKDNARLTVVAASALFCTLGFAVYYFVKRKNGFNRYCLMAFAFATISDAFLALASVTSSNMALSNIIYLFVWPTYLVEYILLNKALQIDLNDEKPSISEKSEKTVKN